MNNEVKETREKEISISTLLKVLRKNLIFILAIAVIFAVIAGAYSMVFEETTYSITVRFYVKNILTTSGYITEGMLTAGAKIADSCVDVANTEYLVVMAFEHFSLDEYFKAPESATMPYVKSMIRAGKTSSESQEFYVVITSKNPEDTLKVAEAVKGAMDYVVKSITTDAEDSVSAPGLLITKDVPKTVDGVSANKPSALKMALIGAAAGVILSYVVFLIIYINDTKVYDEDTIKSNFKYPILASIPQWISEADLEAQKISRKKLLFRDVSKTTRKYCDKLLNDKTPFAITESFKLLRTNLMYSTTAEGTPVFAVTSDFSGSGKSIVTSNLAIAFAQFGKKTLLVECDMRCPDFQRIFDNKLNNVGLSELLSSNVENKNDVPVVISNNNLYVISSGRVPPNPSELLGSTRMKQLVEEWKSEYDVIIFDMPPVFEVTDACVISNYVDGYVIVARTDHSDVDALASSVYNIATVQGNICGFVVNDVNLKIGSSQYGRNAVGKYGKYAKYKKYSAYSNPTVIDASKDDISTPETKA